MFVRNAIAVGVTVLLGVGLGPTLAANAGQVVRPDSFGMHDHGLTAPLSYGAVRLWDTGTMWADIEPAPGVFNFARLDNQVAKARARGASVTLLLGGTPRWAAEFPNAVSAAWLPRGSASPPADLDAWSTYVSTVASRYRGRIDSYQIWNEPSLPMFWQGTTVKLAELTQRAFLDIRAADPHALVVSAPMLPRQRTWASWSLSYLQALRARSWPVDVFAIHSYQPDDQATPDGRVVNIRKMKRLLVQAHAPRRPLWDTEANYTSERYVHHQIVGGKSAQWVARAYLDSLRLGVSRTYWYSYNLRVGLLGLTIAPASAAQRGYQQLQSWLLGATYTGCRTTRVPDARARVARAGPRVQVITCSFSRQGRSFQIAWTSGGRAALPIPATSVCRLLAGCARATARTQLTVAPVRLQ